MAKSWQTRRTPISGSSSWTSTPDPATGHLFVPVGNVAGLRR
ncbi:MAG: hypothetical protein U1F20_06280 [Lysobacterales bacterium]